MGRGFLLSSSVKKLHICQKKMPISSINYSEDVYLYALNVLFGDNPLIGHSIIENMGSAKAFFILDNSEIKRLFPYGSKYPFFINESLLQKASTDISLIKKHSSEFLSCFNPRYPSVLFDYPFNPICLCAKGNTVLLNESKRIFLSIVGLDCFDKISISRLGIFLSKLSDKQYPITIICDLSVKSKNEIIKQSLQYNFPVIGILSCSIDYLWKGLISEIERDLIDKQRGVIITDIPIHSPFASSCSSRHWRLISGMSHAIIQLGCSYTSQSMGICKLAHTFGKELYSYPGRLEDSSAGGSNYLIGKNVAQAIYSTENLISELEHFFSK